MTERGSQSIYDIDFAVLDEKKYSEAVKVPTAVLVEEVNRNGSTPEPIVSLPAVNELIVEPPVGQVVTQPTEVVIHIPRPVVETSPPYVPPEYVDLAETTLDALLEDYAKPIIPIALIVDTAFGQKPSKQDYENLKNALKQNSRLEYLGSKDFKVVGVETDEPYWPEENPHIDTDRVNELAERIIKDIVGRGLGKIFHWQITERVRGEYLNSHEANELLAQVASNQGISAYEDGSFSARLSDEELQNLKDEGRTLSLDFEKPETENETPMTWHQVNRSLKNVRHSPDFRRMKADAKRLANPRRRGRKKKSNLQGRTHNKAKKVQQLIAKMAVSNPSLK